jgi:DNA modification methylase
LTTDNEYLNTWYSPKANHELLLYKSLIEKYQYQDVMKIILSRAARSARIRYSYDALKRIKGFSEIKKDAKVTLFCHDSRTLKVPNFDLIFTSPPYLGLIDYHEQHRYAYELLGLKRRDDEEIGPSFKGQSKKAEKEYIAKIYEVFKNSMNYISEEGRIIIVVGDKKDLYSKIREKLGVAEEKKVPRHVNRRTGRRNSHFFEDILIWKV